MDTPSVPLKAGIDNPSSENIPASKNIFLHKPSTVYARRWYILFLFGLISFVHNAFGIFFPSAKEILVYLISSVEFTYLSIVCCVAFFVEVPIAILVFSRFSESLRMLAVFAAFLGSVGTLVRCLGFIKPHSTWTFWVVCLGQVILASMGPIVMIVPPKLSARWFPVAERTTATGVMVAASFLGISMGTLSFPFLVVLWGFKTFFVVEAALAAVTFMLVLTYFPEFPPEAPTLTASLDTDPVCGPLREGLRQISQNLSFLLLVVSGGWVTGMTLAWQGLLQTVLLQTPPDDLRVVAWLGFSYATSGAVGSVVGGMMADRVLRGRLKGFLVVLLLMSAVIFLVFSLCLPSLFYPRSVLDIPTWSLVVLLVVAGLVTGGSVPLTYELGAELVYPLSPSVSAGGYCLVIGLGFVVTQVGVTYGNGQYLSGALGLSALVCAVLASLLREQYRRFDVDMQPAQGIQD